MPRLGSGIPLVARESELAQLGAALHRAAAGTAGAVLISGDAGVGKSRLLGELLDTADPGTADPDTADPGGGEPVLVLTGHCLDTGEAGDTGLPYLAFAEALGQLAGDDLAAVHARPALGRLLPGLRPPARPGPSPVAARATPGPQPEHDIGQLQLYDAVLGLFAELTERRTVLLCIEDLHWADSATRHLLTLLVSRLRTQRMLLVATYRSDDLHRRHPLRQTLAELLRLPAVQRIELAPLDREQSRTLVTALSELPMAESVVDAVARRCEGNPFFAEELVAAYGETGDGIPPGLADLLLSRVERLGAGAQQVVRLVAVAGKRVTHVRLASVAAAEPGLTGQLEQALREAVAHHVLLVDAANESYRFRHALLGEAIYGDLLPGERVRLHARYADEIAGAPARRGSAAELAHHSMQSHALAGALTASVAAAEEASTLGAPSTALFHVEQALKLWEAVEPAARPAGVAESELLRDASYLAGTSGEPERALSYARASVTRADASADPQLAAKSRRRLIKALTALDVRSSEIVELAEQAWRLVADSPPSALRTWTLATKASIMRAYDDREARAAAELAVAESGVLGPADQVPDPADPLAEPTATRTALPGHDSLRAAVADALTTLGLLDDKDGALSTARKRLGDAVAIAQRSDSPNTELRARHFLALHHYEHGELDEAVRRLEEAGARAAEYGLTWSTFGLELRVLRVVAKFVVGDWAGSAADAAPPGRRVSGTVQARITAVGLHRSVASGEFAEARRALAELSDAWHLDEQIANFAGSCAIELALWQGEPELAARRGTELRTWLLDKWNGSRIALLRLNAVHLTAYTALARAGVDVRAATDELAEESERLLETAVPRTGSLGPEGRAWLAMGRALHGSIAGPGDPAAWRAAVRAFGYGDRYRQAVARWYLAEALHAAGDRAAATEELRTAAQVAEQLGARPLHDELRSFATRARLVEPGAASRRGGTDPLTPRERSVLELVALGRTNREVGEALFISEKTVSVHLSRLMAKLGASRRAEAVALAYDRGLLVGEPTG